MIKKCVRVILTCLMYLSLVRKIALETCVHTVQLCIEEMNSTRNLSDRYTLSDRLQIWIPPPGKFFNVSTSETVLVSLATPFNLKRKRVWWPCVQPVVPLECNNYKNVTGNHKQREADCIVRVPPVKCCQAINSNLESDLTRPNPVARTTHCMHGHQTPLSLELGGVVRNCFFWLLSTQMGKVYQYYPLVPPYFKSNIARMCDVSPTARSAKLQLIYGLKMSKTATLDTFTI